ncbi:hypothetical protein Goari_002757 [Gossypium aridum]|uniref:RNase H type-1 domain-containing protein n=1 Tax=Gossypium aridum TaxID=34290 RepID=A0A7J8Y9C1_GOSAI|nr:hypothetical protein [Gossypium aridum]
MKKLLKNRMAWRMGSGDFKVAELIEPNLRQWKDLVTFCLQGKRHLREERKVWSGEPTGEHTTGRNKALHDGFLQSVLETIQFTKAYLSSWDKKQSNISGTDIVCRDSKGVILGSKTMVNLCVPTLFAAKALACLQAVQTGLHLEYRHVIIKGDGLSVIRKFQSGEEDR